MFAIVALCCILLSSATPCNGQTTPNCLPSSSPLCDELTGRTINSTTTKVIVLIHGWNDGDYPNAYSGGAWASLVDALKTKLAGSDWSLVPYHWERGPLGASTGGVMQSLTDVTGYGHATTAAVRANNAQGPTLATLLNNQAPELKQVHFIAHSAGSWAARDAMSRLLNANANVICQMTLLDPFIPDAANLVGTPTGLSYATMNATATLATNSRIQQLENYCADDARVGPNCPDSFLGFGTLSTPGNDSAPCAPFAWRSDDENLRVDWGQTYTAYYLPIPGANEYYDCHRGPIQFYADTIKSSDGNSSSLGLGNFNIAAVGFNLADVGWKRSLFYKEQQLRATITGVSPPALPASSSPQLVTINGANFKLPGDPNASSLIFYDTANNPYPRTAINVTATSMQYYLTVGGSTGVWKVSVENGEVESCGLSHFFRIESLSALGELQL